ncbi:sulfurtransferase [Solemya velum gill symbiont]|nr:sulfurtransferase [Solemya velum gill symbiont]
MKKLDFEHNGKKHTISRNQDQKNTVKADFAKTSRKCPPFCIQPISLAPGVETLGEVEVINYIEKMASGDSSILVVDSRTPDWVAKGTIPGAVNLPWTGLNPKIAAGDTSKVFDFSNAKTLVMFCNGMWCGQSPNNIMNLLKFGYPADKIKWYRGGMQDWEILGLSTVKP